MAVLWGDPSAAPPQARGAQAFVDGERASLSCDRMTDHLSSEPLEPFVQPRAPSQHGSGAGTAASPHRKCLLVPGRAPGGGGAGASGQPLPHLRPPGQAPGENQAHLAEGPTSSRGQRLEDPEQDWTLRDASGGTALAALLCDPWLPAPPAPCIPSKSKTHRDQERQLATCPCSWGPAARAGGVRKPQVAVSPRLSGPPAPPG